MVSFLQELPVPTKTVPILWRGKLRGPYRKTVRNISAKCWNGTSHFGLRQEGYVMRSSTSFKIEEFGEHTCKFVAAEFSPGNAEWRKGHFMQNDYH